MALEAKRLGLLRMGGDIVELSPARPHRKRGVTVSRIKDLAKTYGRHIATPWQRTVASAQHIVMVVYDKEQERMQWDRTLALKTATKRAGYAWLGVDLAPAFAEWMASDEYREAYFVSPEDLRLKLDAEFPDDMTECIRERLASADAAETSVVAVFGASAPFGLARASRVLGMVEADVRGRLVIFFPDQYEGNNCRFLDIRDSWNYLAMPITLGGPAAGTERSPGGSRADHLARRPKVEAWAERQKAALLEAVAQGPVLVN